MVKLVAGVLQYRFEIFIAGENVDTCRSTKNCEATIFVIRKALLKFMKIWSNKNLDPYRMRNLCQALHSQFKHTIVEPHHE